MTDLGTLDRDAVKKLLLLVGHLIDAAGNKDGGMFGRDSLGSVGRCGFAGCSPTRNQPRHHGAFARITLLTDFMIEARGVMATFLPALVEIVGKLVHLRWPTVWRLPFGKLPSSQPTPNGFPFDPQGAADRRLGLAGLEQREDFLVALQPPLSAQLRLRRLG